MRKIKSVVAMSVVATLAVAGGVLATTGSASAESVYTLSYINRCANVKGTHDCVGLQANSTYSATQIWINGSVFCGDEQGNVDVTWCGVGGGNGTATLNIGVNFNFGAVTGLYERMDIYANDGGCSTWGSNSDVDGISQWWNAGSVVCEEPA
jgi:hypothetical protein